MTINSTTRKTNVLVGNGNTATYPFAFKVFKDEDVVVKKLEAATSAETTLTLGVSNDYIVTLSADQNSNPGGSITLKSGGNNQNLASGFSIVITSAVEPLQGTDLTNQGGFFPEVINDALDKAVVLHQQQQEKLDRSISFSLTNTIGSLEITENAAARKNRVLGFDNTGEFEVLKELGTYRGNWAASTAYAVRDLVKDTSTNNIFFCNTAHTSSGAQPLTTNTHSANWDLIVDAATATTSATNAASSATAAASSATAAATSATAAATSATSAASSATTATTKATAADTAKTAAETAQAAAETAKTAAETALDSFDDRYLGTKSSNPTLDNDGNALLDGALYFNTTSNIMRVYDLGNTTWLEVTIVGSDLTNTNTVAGAISNVNAVGGSIANVNTVATNINNVNTVAADIAKVVKVADDLNETVSEIEVAAADLQETTSEIDTVANSIANVDLVGQNIGNINALGQVLAGQTTFTITVQNVGGSNYFFVDGVQAPALNLIRGYTYIFDQSNNTNSGHPLAFKDGSGNSYTSGVTVNGTAGQANANVTFVIPSNAPASLRYYCTVHGNGMGNTITVGDDNIGVVASSISNVNTVGGAIANVNNVGSNIANVNTVATGLAGVNAFAERYRVGSTNPTSNNDNGDLFYNTNLGKLLVYNATTSAWEETQTIGNFFINTISQFSGTGGNSATFNGAAYKFTLSNAGQFAQQMLVSINGVVQKPNAGTGQPSEGFALDGSEIVFSSAPPTGADYFIVTIGATVSIGTPSNGTVTPASFANGTSNNNGKFLRANNGAAPSFETVNTDLVSDSSPQLGGDLQSNGNDIDFADNDKAVFGSGSDLQIYHDSNNSLINASGTGNLIIQGANDIILRPADGEVGIDINANGAVDLYYDNSKKFETSSTGNQGTGVLKLISGNGSTSSDDNILHIVSGGTATRGIKLGTGRATGSAQNDGMGYIDAIDSESSGYGAQIQLRVNASRIINVGYQANKYVGINEDDPGYELVVAAQDANESTLQIKAGGNGKESNILFGAPDDADVGKISYDHNGDHMKFITGTTERFRVNSNGICLGGTGSANGLDDYEEGTWTPSFSGDINFSTKYNFTYTKIGRIVHITGYLHQRSGSFSATWQITNLPFAGSGNYNMAPLWSHGVDLAFMAYIADSSTNLNIRDRDGATAQPNELSIQMTYITST